MADRRIVSRRGSERLGRHGLAEIERGRPAFLVQLTEQRRIVRRIGDDGDESMILRGGANHRRATNIDVFDHFIAFRAFGHGLLEGIEIDDDEIDRADGVIGHCLRMFRIVTHGQQPAMDHRVQRLDPAIHHFGKTGEVRHVLHRKPGIAQRLGRAAGGDQFHAQPRQALPQFNQAALVGHREQCPLDRDFRHHGITPFS